MSTNKTSKIIYFLDFLFLVKTKYFEKLKNNHQKCTSNKIVEMK